GGCTGRRPRRAGAVRRERRSGVGSAHSARPQRGDSCGGTAMIRRLVALAGAALIISSTAQAQTTTDGVDAFLRGDYSRAAEILTPLVSPTRPPDHVAQFFLAAMYENGLGVPIDPTRACALYARVAADSTGAFAAQGAALMDAVSQLLGPDPVKECLAPPASPPRDDPDSGSAFVSEPAARVPKIRGRASRRTRGRHRAGASNGSLSRAISPTKDRDVHVRP